MPGSLPVLLASLVSFSENVCLLCYFVSGDFSVIAHLQCDGKSGGRKHIVQGRQCIDTVLTASGELLKLVFMPEYNLVFKKNKCQLFFILSFEVT